MNSKGILIIFFILLLASTVSVFAEEEHEHDNQEGETLTVNGYEIGLATEPESPKVGEVHLVVHIESDGESVSGLHVEIQITEMEMHSGEMEEHMVLTFEEGHAHEEDELGHYALHHEFEEESDYMIRVKIEDVGVTDAFHITVGGSFQKGELTVPLIFLAVGVGVAAIVVASNMRKSFKIFGAVVILIVVVVFPNLFLLGPNFLAATEETNHEHTEDGNGDLTTFGPGKAPHLHEVDLTTFDTVADIAKSPIELPPSIERDYPTTVKILLVAKEVISEIATNITYHYWTFNETIPGPFLRGREGDTFEITISNHITSSHNHSIDLHAVTGPGGGSVLTQVEPGEAKTFRFKALNPGLFVYHCATHNIPMHIANGMYGLILVEPEEGLPKVDKEFYIMQGELYTKGKIGDEGFQEFDAEKMLYGNPEYVTFNGRIKALVDHSLKASVGDKVRLYVGNAGLSFVSSFHVIGEIFDTVYPEASTSTMENVQTTTIPAGGATIVEFTLEVPGTCVLVDHALARIEKGAWGLLEVEGPENPEIYSPVE